MARVEVALEAAHAAVDSEEVAEAASAVVPEEVALAREAHMAREARISMARIFTARFSGVARGVAAIITVAAVCLPH